MERKQQESQIGIWVMKAFGGLFFCVGLFVLWMMGSATWKNFQVGSWHETDAVIISAHVKSYSGSEATTYAAKAEYEYFYKGQSFRSDRLYVQNWSDSRREHHRKIVQDLLAVKRSGGTVPIRLNPKDPQDSVMFFKGRWGVRLFQLLFGGLFSAIGAGILWGVRYGQRLETIEAQNRLENPQAPWTWRKEWTSQRLKSQGKQAFYGVMGFAIFWNMISWPIAALSFGEVSDNKLALLTWLFPAVGLGLVYWTYKQYKRWRYFGQTELILDTHPIALGRDFVARLAMPLTPPEETIFEFTLTCTKVTEGHDSDTHSPIWQDEQFIQAKHGQYSEGYFELPIMFSIPQDQPHTSLDHEYPRIYWNLTVKAEAGHIDFHEKFDLAVFDPNLFKMPDYTTPISERHHSVTGSNYSRVKDIETYAGDWRKTGVIYSQEGDAQSYYFPSGRHKIEAAGLILFGCVFAGIGGLKFILDDFPTFITVIFGGSGLVVMFWGLHMALMKSALHIHKGDLDLRRGLFKGRFRHFAQGDIVDVKVTSNMSSDNVVIYDLKAVTSSGDDVALAHYMKGRRDIEMLALKIKNDLGL